MTKLLFLILACSLSAHASPVPGTQRLIDLPPETTLVLAKEIVVRAGRERTHFNNGENFVFLDDAAHFADGPLCTVVANGRVEYARSIPPGRFQIVSATSEASLVLWTEAGRDIVSIACDFVFHGKVVNSSVLNEMLTAQDLKSALGLYLSDLEKH